MFIIAHGVDLVRCERIERVWREHGARFLERIYTPAEREYCLGHRTAVVQLSGRFAAKEAVMKVLGTGWRGGMRWTDIEILPDALGRPVVRLHGETLQMANRARIDQVLLSISHTDEHALASAIGVGALS